MARSDTRGLVYQCKECGWRGEKCYGVAHVAKKHVKYAKFYCHVCKVGAATQQAIDKHVEQKRHCRRAAEYEGEATTYHGNNKPELLLAVWSKEESERFWKKNEEERNERKMKEGEEKEAEALEGKRGKREADGAQEDGVEDQKKETEAAGAPESKRRKLETEEEESRQEEPHQDEEMEEETREEDLTEIEEEGEKKEDEKTEEENEDRRLEQKMEEEKKEEKTEEEEKKGKEPEKTEEKTAREKQRHVEKTEEEKKEKEPEKTQDKSEREKQKPIEKTAENEVKSKEEERNEQAKPKQTGDKPRKEPLKKTAENQETCGEVRTVTLHRTHKQISNKEKKQEEKMEEESALSRLALDLEMSPSPSPSSSPAFSDFSEGNFAPDYTEEPDSQVREPTSQGPVYSLTPEAVKFLVERPSQQATAIAAVSSQIIATNHCLTDIAAKINDEHKAQDPLLHTVLVQIKGLVADVRNELRTANKNAEEERELRKATNIALRDLTSALRQQDATNRALQTALATQGMRPGPRSTAPPAPAMDPSILKMAGEFDVDWAALQWDQETTKTQRRPEWPNFDTPQDRSESNVQGPRRPSFDPPRDRAGPSGAQAPRRIPSTVVRPPPPSYRYNLPYHRWKHQKGKRLGCESNIPLSLRSNFC